MKRNTWAEKLTALGLVGAGVCASGSAQAAVFVGDVNQTVGFRGGDLSSYTIPLPGLADLQVLTWTTQGIWRGVRARTSNRVQFRRYRFISQSVFGTNFARRTSFGKTFSQVPGSNQSRTLFFVQGYRRQLPGYTIVRTYNGSFPSTKYFAFRFKDSTDGDNWKYGWLSATGSIFGGGNPANTFVTILQYGYDDSGAKVTMGQGGTPVPEPESMLPAAVLALGAAGLRRWRKQRAAVAAQG